MSGYKTVTRMIDSCNQTSILDGMTLDEAITKLHEMKQEYGDRDIRFGIENLIWCDNPGLYLYEHREETEYEYLLRTQENDRRARLTEQRERAEYERLHKKFNPMYAGVKNE